LDIIELLIIFGGGISAGILGGLLGIGGGIVLMPILKILFGIAFSYVSYQYILIFFQGRY
jgi:uncharacterized membrane protein YfcA